jgi:FAD/FMN-containing dehydrogenase
MPTRTPVDTLSPATDKFADAIRAGVRGRVLGPGDAGYDDARRVWNARIDRRPRLVLRCADAADVAHAVVTARRHGVPLSIRSSGHNVAGFAVCDGGLVLDLSYLKGLRVDPARRRVRAEPGVRWCELDRATQEHGLATTGGRISTTGVAGLTLGGGHGWLMRSCGLTVDNLRSVELVTADGRLLEASPTENAELFWGLRGGGGNFGVVTSFEFCLHRIGPTVTGGAVFYPVEEAGELLRVYRDFMASAPDELAALFNLLIAPAAPFVPPHLHGVPVAAIAVCHVGPVEQARRDLAPLRRACRPLLDRVGEMPYTVLQRLFDAAGEFGRCVVGRSGYLVELGDDAIDVLVHRAEGISSPLSIVMISPLGGAVARVPAAETAYSHRNAAYSLAVDSVWTDPADSARHVRWTEKLWAAVAPFTSGVYVNELGDEGRGRVLEAYGPATYRRLVALKDEWDPANVFRLNQNIEPSGARR